MSMAMIAAMAAGQPASAEEKTILHVAHENGAFAFELYQALRAGDGNLFFSPYSISTAFAMMYGGARGETAQQMGKTLHFDLPQAEFHAAFGKLQAHVAALSKGDAVTLALANSLWLNPSFTLTDAFTALVEQAYGANLFFVDFMKQPEESRAQINAWVAEQTRQKIAELLKSGDVNSDTRVVLANAIYFQANWRDAFDEKQTWNAPFWISNDEQIETPTMQQTGAFEYGETDDMQILALPYAGESVYMVILLPRAPDGLAKIEAQMSMKRVMEWLRLTEKQKVVVALPKFALRFHCDILETMGAMGFTSVNDFSGMAEEPLTLSKVIHEAMVDVNEQGSEAAAATGAVMSRSMARHPEFQANHPFAFFMIDVKTDSILFVGRVVNPAKS